MRRQRKQKRQQTETTRRTKAATAATTRNESRPNQQPPRGGRLQPGKSFPKQEESIALRRSVYQHAGQAPESRGNGCLEIQQASPRRGTAAREEGPRKPGDAYPISQRASPRGSRLRVTNTGLEQARKEGTYRIRPDNRRP